MHDVDAAWEPASVKGDKHVQALARERIEISMVQNMTLTYSEYLEIQERAELAYTRDTHELHEAGECGSEECPWCEDWSIVHEPGILNPDPPDLF